MKRFLPILTFLGGCVVGGLAVWVLLPPGRKQQLEEAAEPIAVAPSLKVAIPPEHICFYLVKPSKEKRSGLYAMAEAQTPEIPELFTLLADGKVVKPVEGKAIMLVGKLPWEVTEPSFFKPEEGVVKGGEVRIPVKYVAFIGPDESRRDFFRPVYFTVYLPAMPVGKYKATVTFADYEHRGDRQKIVESEKEFLRFKPLTCEFEVQEAKQQ